MSESGFKTHLNELRFVVDAALTEELRKATWPFSLKSAVEYSLMAGGKRLRPVLVLLANNVCGGRQEDAISAACAIEMVHTYSLIHDDLPSMDNDDFRRGRPTSHKVFGEALAILAGDCLLTLAFETITAESSSSGIWGGKRVFEQIRILATAAGGSGMVGGQTLDLEAERGAFVIAKKQAFASKDKGEPGYDFGSTAVHQCADSADISTFKSPRMASKSDSDLNDSNQTAETRVVELSQIHKMKTGALIAGALELAQYRQLRTNQAGIN